MIHNDYKDNKTFIQKYILKRNRHVTPQEFDAITNTFSDWEREVVLTLPDRWADYRELVGLDWDEVLEMYLESKFGIPPLYLTEQEPYRKACKKGYAIYNRKIAPQLNSF